MEPVIKVRIPEGEDDPNLSIIKVIPKKDSTGTINTEK